MQHRKKYMNIIKIHTHTKENFQDVRCHVRFPPKFLRIEPFHWNFEGFQDGNPLFQRDTLEKFLQDSNPTNFFMNLMFQMGSEMEI